MATFFQKLFGTGSGKPDVQPGLSAFEQSKQTPPTGFSPTEIVIDGRVVGRTTFIPGRGIVVESLQTPEEQQAQALLRQRQESIIQQLLQEPPEFIAEREAFKKTFFESQQALTKPFFERERSDLESRLAREGIDLSSLAEERRLRQAEQEGRFESQAAREAELASQDLRNQQFNRTLQQLAAVRGGIGEEFGRALQAGQFTSGLGAQQQQFGLAASELALRQQQGDKAEQDRRRQEQTTALLGGVVLGLPTIQDIFRRRTTPQGAFQGRSFTPTSSIPSSFGRSF